MKCQAFVKYPTVELASSALLQVHGVVLKDKPLIVVSALIDMAAVTAVDTHIALCFFQCFRKP